MVGWGATAEHGNGFIIAPSFGLWTNYLSTFFVGL